MTRWLSDAAHACGFTYLHRWAKVRRKRQRADVGLFGFAAAGWTVTVVPTRTWRNASPDEIIADLNAIATHERKGGYRCSEDPARDRNLGPCLACIDCRYYAPESCETAE